MRPEMQRLAASAIIPALLVFALYALKALETGMGWDFTSWGFYFYRGIAPAILACVWTGSGLLTFIIARSAWHVGASGLIYGLAFFLFFSGLLRRHVPLVALSLLVTFLYGSLVWNMFPDFAEAGTSWEGHLAGAVTGTACAFAFRNRGPQRPQPFADEEEEDEQLPAGEEEQSTEDENKNRAPLER